MRTIRQITRNIRLEIRRSEKLGKKGTVLILDDGTPEVALLKKVLETIVTNPKITIRTSKKVSGKYDLLLKPHYLERYANIFLSGVLNNKPSNLQDGIYPFRSISKDELSLLAKHHGIKDSFSDDLGLLSIIDEFAPGTKNATTKSVNILEKFL
jgi:hypothetical protein